MENAEISTKKREVYSKIVIIQSICVMIILISVFITKFIFKDTFLSVKELYKENVCVDTDINQVLESAGDLGDINEV